MWLDFTSHYINRKSVIDNWIFRSSFRKFILPFKIIMHLIIPYTQWRSFYPMNKLLYLPHIVSLWQFKWQHSIMAFISGCFIIATSFSTIMLSTVIIRNSDSPPYLITWSPRDMPHVRWTLSLWGKEQAHDDNTERFLIFLVICRRQF